jgi:hypothetical protein
MAYTTIDNPFKYFNTVLHTGNGSARTITGVGFQPDWVWLKSRSSSGSHYFYDVARGDNLTLQSNSTAAEANVTTDFTGGGVGSQASDGFTIVAGTSNTDNVNTNSTTYVSWNWLAGGTASSNSDGSITSSVSASTTAGFSIVSYTGNATAGATVGHGLGSVPKMIIQKNRSVVENWATYHASLGNANNLLLNGTNASVSTSDYNSTSPTSSVFSLGSGSGTNGNGNNMIAYCFAEKKGYSKFGSYTGNGNADGAFVYTGFKPAWIMVKRTGGVTNWQIQDSKRDGFNDQNKRILANVNEAEKTSQMWDQLSNGFKIRVTSENANGSGMSYIYMAFAEAPFVTAGTKAAGTAR